MEICERAALSPVPVEPDTRGGCAFAFFVSIWSMETVSPGAASFQGPDGAPRSELVATVVPPRAIAV